MHIQARAKPSKSPANLADFLRELAADPATNQNAINIEGVTGASVEQGGHFVFTVQHGRARDAHDRLTARDRNGDRYVVEWTKDLHFEQIPPPPDPGSTAAPSDEDPNRPGVLLEIVQRAKEAQIAAGRDIDTVMIGALTDEPGRFFAQVTFHGSDWTQDRPGQDD